MAHVGSPGITCRETEGSSLWFLFLSHRYAFMLFFSVTVNSQRIILSSGIPLNENEDIFNRHAYLKEQAAEI